MALLLVACHRAPGARMSADTTPRPALWKPGEVSPAHLTGEMPGDVGFDPLLLTALAKKPVLDLVTGGFPNRVQREIIMANQTPEQQRASVAWMRDAELKHARLAMLAAVGWPLAELINPVQQLLGYFCRAHDEAVRICACETYAATFLFEWHSPPTQPHVSVFNLGNPKTVKAAAANPFVYVLPPDDLARLAADPASRARWVELVTHTMLPPLRELAPITQSQVRKGSPS